MGPKCGASWKPTERILIGEIYLPLQRLVAYHGEKQVGVHLPFNFQLLFTAWQASSVVH